jgi:class 3 adenylate cyclase
VEERTLEITKKKEELEIQKAEVEVQKKKSDDLLLNILPEDVAEELKQTGKAAARMHPEATVMFMDIISFTNHAESISPDKLVAALDDFFGRIDKIVWEAGIEKIKTIGDAYLCAAGLPIPDEKHAEKMVKAAFSIIESLKAFNQERMQSGELPFQFRIGIHSGPVVSGVVGTRKFAYDIWGDTVNTASRMESKSEQGKINISGTTYELIKDKFNCASRGALEAKNKGLIPMYFVESEK